MSNRTLSALLCSLLVSVLPTVAAQPVPALTGLSASASYAKVGNLKPGNTVTLEAWVYPTGWREYSGREKHGLNFLVKGLLGSHWDFIFALQENGILCIGNTYGYLGVMNKRVPASKWTHVAVTINNNTGDIRFYINGAYVGNGSGWQGRNPARKGFISYSGNELDIGGFNQRGWGYNNDNFRGQMADVRIWSVVRTPQQIAANYNKQLSGKEAGLMAYWTFADKKDKTGHGWNLTLGGDAKLTPKKGPSLDTSAAPSGGSGGSDDSGSSPAKPSVSASMKAVTPYYTPVGSNITLSASASSTSGSISAATFKISSLDGEISTNLPSSTLENKGTECTASVSWVPERSGIYSVSVSVTNANLKRSATSKAVTFGVNGPFFGAPVSVYDRIQAENFNVGTNGVAYKDTTPKNTSGLYRPGESADIAMGPSTYVLTNAVAGEWLRYDVFVPDSDNDGGDGGDVDPAPASRVVAGGDGTANVQSNRFLLSVRLSANGTGGAFSIKPDDSNNTNWPAVSVSVPNTGSWKTFKTVEKAVWLPASFSALRLTMDQNGSSGQVACFDWFSLADFVFELASTTRDLPKAAAQSKQFSFEATGSWSAKTDANWISLRTTSGSGNGKILYDVAANNGPDRTGKITVSCAGEAKVYTVNQEGSGPAFLSLPSESRELGNAAATWKQCDVKANIPWTAQSGASWLKLRTTGANGSSRLFFDVAANNTTSPRTGKITIKGSGLSSNATYTVTQQGIDPSKLYLYFVASNRTFSAAAATGQHCAVKSTVSWTAKADAAWIKLRTKGAPGSSRLFYDVAANKAGPRTGHITVSGNGLKATYTITQKGLLSLPSAKREFSAAAAKWKEFSVSGSGNVAWSVSTSSKWIKLHTKSGKNSGTVAFDVTANTGSKRVGHIYVKSSTQTLSYEVTQKARSKALDRDGVVYPVVEASDGTDAYAIVDGDFATSWSPAGEDGTVLLLSLDPEAPVPGENVCVWGDLPAETRIYGAAEDGDWTLVGDDAPDSAYTDFRIDIPATYGLPSISDVTFAPLGD